MQDITRCKLESHACKSILHYAYCTAPARPWRRQHRSIPQIIHSFDHQCHTSQWRTCSSSHHRQSSRCKLRSSTRESFTILPVHTSQARWKLHSGQEQRGWNQTPPRSHQKTNVGFLTVSTSYQTKGDLQLTILHYQPKGTTPAITYL